MQSILLLRAHDGSLRVRYLQIETEWKGRRGDDDVVSSGHDVRNSLGKVLASKQLELWRGLHVYLFPFSP